MKKFILKRIQGLYNYYSTGATADIPYFKTMSVFLLLIFLHYLELAFLLYRFADAKFDLFPFTAGAGRGLRALIIFVCFVPIYILITWLFPKSMVTAYSYSDDKLATYRNQFFFYAGFLLVAIIATIWPSIMFR